VSREATLFQRRLVFLNCVSQSRFTKRRRRRRRRLRYIMDIRTHVWAAIIIIMIKIIILRRPCDIIKRIYTKWLYCETKRNKNVRRIDSTGIINIILKYYCTSTVCPRPCFMILVERTTGQNMSLLILALLAAHNILCTVRHFNVVVPFPIRSGTRSSHGDLHLA